MLIENNKGLSTGSTTIAGFTGLASVTGRVSITGNTRMTDITGFKFSGADSAVAGVAITNNKLGSLLVAGFTVSQQMIGDAARLFCARIYALVCACAHMRHRPSLVRTLFPSCKPCFAVGV